MKGQPTTAVAVPDEKCRTPGCDAARQLYSHHCATHQLPPALATLEARQLRGQLVEPTPEPVFDLIAHLRRQRAFSECTFGPGSRLAGVLDHLRKELREVEAKPTDISEWIDLVLLAFDGAWRQGFTPEQIATALAAKQARNEARTWPDWRTMPEGKAIEHDRSAAP
jgi:hypothetical protein